MELQLFLEYLGQVRMLSMLELKLVSGSLDCLLTSFGVCFCFFFFKFFLQRLCSAPSHVLVMLASHPIFQQGATG
jgi:hypothetical protein